MASRFPNSTLHQRDSRSALFEGYTGGGDASRRQVSASPSPRPMGGGYGYSGASSYNHTNNGGIGGYGHSGGGSSYLGGGGGGGGGGTPGNEGGGRGYRAATPNARGQYDTATLDTLESQNDAQMSGVLGKVAILKSMSVAMGDEIRSSSALMEKMNGTFDNTRVKLRGTMNRMLLMAERTGVGWRVWLGFFVVVMLVFGWVWLF